MMRALWLTALMLPAMQALALDNLTQDLLGLKANGNSYSTTVSEDGRYIVFDSEASNLLGSDTNNARDIYLYDRDSGVLELISVDNSGNRGNGHSSEASISADGRYVVFQSVSALAAGGNNGVSQIYLRDRQTHTTRLVSADIGGVAGNGPSYRPHISADGSLVVFDSLASNLSGQDSNNYSDVFIKHIASGEVERVSMAAGGGQANNGSYEARMSRDGRYVVFVSQAGNIVSPAIAPQRLVYLRDRQTGTVRLVSVNSAGVAANGACYLPDVDDQGKQVVYYSLAANLVPGLSGTTVQAIRYAVDSGTTHLVSRAADGSAGNDHSYYTSISGDGRYVAFISFAGNLVAGDANGKSDVFVRDLASDELTIASRTNGGGLGNGNVLGSPSMSTDSSVVAFSSYASNLVAQDDNGFADVFITARVLNTPPVAVAGPSQVLECSGATTPVTLDGRASSDADGDSLDYTWNGDFGQATGAVVTVPMALGSHSAALVVDDGRGGQDSATTGITILDSVAPSLSVPGQVSLEADSRDGAAYELVPVATDACGSVGIAIAPSYSIYPLGNNAITVTATDGSGNSRSTGVVVSVADTTAPQLQAPPDLSREAQERQTALDIGQATASDIFDVTVSNNAPPAFPLGTTVVTWRAEDSNGNASEADQSITIADTTPPVFLSVPTDVVTEATALLTPLTLPTASASDIFDVTLGNNSPGAFPLGTTVVTWRATDSSGNLATATQQVTVRDTTPPALVAPPDVTVEASGLTSPVTLGTASAQDIFPVSLGNNAPPAFPLGTSRVTWQASDSSGNTTTAIQRVTVRDTTAPLLKLPADRVVEASGPLTPVALIPATASDIFAVNLSNNAPALFPLGTTVVTWRAEDSNGNTSSGQQRITVVDTTAPERQFEQLHDILWPPNNRMREVARLANVHDLVDAAPVVAIDVQVIDTPREQHRRGGEWSRGEHPVHGGHDDRGRAVARHEKADGKHAWRAGLRHGQRGEHHHRRHHRPDWKVVERDGVWHIYVRARVPDFDGERRYDILATVSDASGNQGQSSAQVRVLRPERHHH